ncbi:MAG: hypothetical protein ACRD0A_19265 [Acidimicrobiales bacterium]
MNDDELRDILGRVAAGELDADEAARLLDPDATPPEDDADDLDDGDPDVDFDAATEPPPGDIATELRVSASARKLRIVGDPSVREVLVRGAQIRRENGILVVDAEPEWYDSEDETHSLRFVFAGGPPWWGGEGEWDRDWDRRRQRGRHRGGRGSRRFEFNPPVDIRANPDLSLSLDVSAASVRVSGMRGKIVGSVSAGSAAFADVRGPFDLNVSAGSLSVHGPIARGDSRIRCDIGSVKVRLEPGSDLRVKVDATMSKPDVRVAGWGGRTDEGEWVVGDGTASLAIVASMSAVKVRETS